MNGLEFLGLWGYALIPPQRLSGQGQLDAKAPPSGAAGGAPAAVALDLSNPKLTQFELCNCTGATLLVLDGGELGANGVELGIYLPECETLTELKVNGKRVVSVAATGCNRLTKLDCTDTSIRHLPDYALFEVPSLSEVLLPTTLRRVGHFAFAGCSKLEVLAMPPLVERIGHLAFSGTSIRDMVLPRTLRKLGPGAFYDCVKLVLIDMSATALYTLEESLCCESPSLATVKLPATLRSIRQFAFKSCTSLMDFSWGDIPGLERLGNYAFQGSGLSSVELPAALKTIGARVFAGCERLERADLGKCVGLEWTRLVKSSRSDISQGAFADCDRLSEVVLPPGLGTTVHLRAPGLRGFHFIRSGESGDVFRAPDPPPP